MKKRLLKKLLFLILFMSGNFFFAQTVKGKVSSGGFSLPGVSVIVEGTKNGTNTDFSGDFTLNNVPPGSILVFSYIGFKTEKLQADTNSSMEVVMFEDAQKLEEVVVIGYGTSKRKDITGSVVSIKADQIKDQPFTSLDQALVAKAAGVNVTQNSGTPGGGISVQIRGITSINGNEPLYVIDGTPIFADQNNSTSSFGSTTGIGGQSKSSALNGINPADIESIDILKDASATAIYGANGANGVVLITTKKGKNGKSTFTYDAYTGITEIANFIDMMDLRDFARYKKDLIRINSEENGNIPYTIPFQYENPDLLGKGTNWQKEIFRPALSSNHQLSFSGDNNGTRYYTSLGYLNQEGALINSDFNRLSLRLNLESKVKDWLKIGNNLSVARTFQNNVRNDQRGGAIYNALRQSPEIPVRNADGSFAGPTSNLGTTFNEASNPVALSELIRSQNLRYKINGNLFTETKLLKDLTYRTELGYDINFANLSFFRPTYTLGTIESPTNESFKQQENSVYWNLKNIFNYNKTVNDHTFGLMAGHEVQRTNWEFLNASRLGFDTNNFDVLPLGTVGRETINNAKGQWAMESYITRFTYGYSDRYALTASFRADGSSNFGKGNRWGYFPAISGGWTLSNEKIFEGAKEYINYLKFKGGYGLTGNQNIQSFAYQTLINLGPSALGGNAYDITQIANPNVKWEALKSLNVGLEIAFMNDAIKLDVEYFEKVSSDFLSPEPENSSNVGLPKRILNVGEITNQGYDLTLNTRNISNDKFNWNTTVIFSTYKNKLVDYFDSPIFRDAEVEGGGGTQKPVTITRIGEALAQFYGFVENGIYKSGDDLTVAPKREGTISPQYGDVKFVDLNGDNIINDQDRTVIGNPFPDFIYTITNELKYKNLDFSLTLQGSQGNDVINYTRRYTEGYTDLNSNQSTVVNDRFILGVNEDTNVPRATIKDTYGNKEVSTRYVEDGSFLRIQNIAIGYELSPKMFERIKFISKARIYANIQNLYTFTKYTGLDPSIGSNNGDILKTGVDEGRYPISRTYTLGLNLQF